LKLQQGSSAQACGQVKVDLIARPALGKPLLLKLHENNSILWILHLLHPGMAAGICHFSKLALTDPVTKTGAAATLHKGVATDKSQSP
jgi:hypothetical protein